MTMLLAEPRHLTQGVHLPPNKAQSLQRPLQAAHLPRLLTIPLRQHIGTTCTPVVAVGERVFKGQRIAHPQGVISAPIHASSSGVVVAIADRPVPSPSGRAAPCVVIETDGLDEWLPHAGVGEDVRDLHPIGIHDRIHAAGIVGLGGAGFPAAAKILPGIRGGIDLLIVNAAECEPYITCDQALIRRSAREIIIGLDILRRAVRARECVIGIEDDHPEAVTALETAIGEGGGDGVRVVPLPPLYPAGGEKQLIKALTGLEVPARGLPLDLHMVCYNIGTVHAVYKAVALGEPLISRVVTITGNAVRHPQNLEALIGTPIAELVELCGGYIDDVACLLMGGPMMGFGLSGDDLPVIKTTNCVIAATAAEVPPRPPAMPCIRCGDCTRVCPIHLLPYEIYLHAQVADYDRARDFQLFDCIECGCCAYVCPSHIPLVGQFQVAKAAIHERERQRLRSNRLRRAHDRREARLETRTDELAARRPLDTDQARMRMEIEDAILRAAARKTVDGARRDDEKPQSPSS